MPRMKTLIKKIYRVAGIGVVLACLGFLVWQLSQNAAGLGTLLADWGTLLLLALAAVVYAGIFMLLACGWHVLLRHLGAGALSFRNTLYVYTKASIGKYLPGNVGHFVGRQLIARYTAVPQSAVAASTLLEILCQIIAAAIICLWVDLPITQTLSPAISFALSGLVLLAAPFAIIILGNRLNLEIGRNATVPGLYRAISLTCIFDIAFFLATGGLVYWLMAQLGVGGSTPVMRAITIYAVAWFAGLITPGAPAGLGVRETIMVAMFSPDIGKPEALVVAMLFRIITSLGDVLFFSISFIPWLRLETETQAKQDNI